MKLNPPASSSDLEIARQIARRLHQHRRRDDRGAISWAAEEAERQPSPAPPPLRARPAPAEPPLAGPEPVRRSARAALEPTLPEPPFDLPEAQPGGHPSWSEPQEFGYSEPAPLEELAGPAEPAPFTLQEPQLPPEPALPDVEMEEPPLSPEELVGEALLEPPPAADEPAPPSWDEIVDSCLELAQARGAMLADSAGQVFSARGEWPAPGPNTIATKLVAMMAETLKDAPTRSISAPLMGMHLTAWRVPLDDGLVTAAFIGATPVPADVRPAINGEIHRGRSGVGS